MEKFKKLTDSLTSYSFFWIFICNLFGIGAFLLTHEIIHQSILIGLIAGVVVAFALSMLSARLVVLAATQPLRAVWQAVWHVSPRGTEVPAPDLSHMTHGKEVAETLNTEVYSLATVAPAPKNTAQPEVVMEAATAQTSTSPTDNTSVSRLLELMPIPIVALNKDSVIVLVNKSLASYIGRPIEEIINKPFTDVFHLSFQSEDTLDNWLQQSALNSISANSSWDRIKLPLADQQTTKMFDLVAHYNKDNTNGYETILAFFDHTDKYLSDDNSASYVALAVHELRTPLTMLRGYIEVFEDELDDKLTPELRDFMHKMSASAQTLTAFVSNILNVARVDENQLNLSLHEANWNELLVEICKDLELRVKVRGKVLELDVAPNLPTVAIDKVSIYEVLSNLVDNAVKYSDKNPKIIIHAAVGKDGEVETVVQDFGLGVPAANLKYLFTKFYRSHRSSSKVGGTGLGLYIVKAIVAAHGGHVWVSSKEGEGSSFGFSLQPFSAVKDELGDNNQGIERQAHGWIKNHSIYRR